MKVPQRLTDRKHIAIIQAAIAEFRNKGFAAANMDKIAASAVVSKRTVYNHFSSKEKLFDAVLLHLWASSAQELELTYSDIRPIRDQLQDFLLSKMRVLNDPSFLDLLRIVTALSNHSPIRSRHLINQLREREEGFVNWVRAAQADDKLKAADPCFVAHQVQAVLKEFAFWPQITWGNPCLSPATQLSVVEATSNMFLISYELPVRNLLPPNDISEDREGKFSSTAG
jgi:TetR/AcrR family transcriptional regulator of autoinduction and epiphytic fitness